MKDVILGLARHLLTAGAGVLVAHGYAAQADVQLIVGGLLALLGAGLSAYDKLKK